MEASESNYAKVEEGRANVVAVPADSVVVLAQPVEYEPATQAYTVNEHNDVALLQLPADARQEEYCCAQVGCIFSWIPIIGFITYCLNCDAAPNSRRRHFATMSCWIALSIVIIQMIIYFATM